MRWLWQLADAGEWPLQTDAPQERRFGTALPALAERTRRAGYASPFECVRPRCLFSVAHAEAPSRHSAWRIELPAQLSSLSAHGGSDSAGSVPSCLRPRALSVRRHSEGL